MQHSSGPRETAPVTFPGTAQCVPLSCRRTSHYQHAARVGEARGADRLVDVRSRIRSAGRVDDRSSDTADHARLRRCLAASYVRATVQNLASEPRARSVPAALTLAESRSLRDGRAAR